MLLPIQGKGIIALLKGENLAPFTGGIAFIDPEGAEKPFAPHYEQYIRPHVRSFEQQRIRTLHQLRKRWFIALPAIFSVSGLMIAAISIFSFSNDTNEFIFGAGAVFILCISIWASYPTAVYKSTIKEKVFPHIFSFFGEDFNYSAKNLLPIRSLGTSGILPDYNGEKSEDYVKGSYKDVRLELTEAKLTKTTGSGKHRRTVTKFKGIFMLLSMNKPFSGKTIVRRDAGAIGNWFSSKFSDLETVRLEDPVFENKFEIYSSDQMEARYLLTTSFMERLLALSKLFGDSGIQCSFYDNRLLLMIPSKENRFETASIFKPATFMDDINTILKEMRLLFEIIDVLKLNERTGL